MRVYSGQSRTSWSNYEDIRDPNDVFTAVAAQRPFTAALDSAEGSARLAGEQTSTNYFEVLGVAAARGRTFSPNETRRDLIVIADHVWRGRFASDPAIVGRTVRLANGSYEVIGVMPPRFRGVAPPGMTRDFWMPIDGTRPDAPWRARTVPYVEVFARLRPDVSTPGAQAVMQVRARQIRDVNPELPDSFLRTEVFPLDGVYAFRGMAGSFLPVFAFLGLLTVVSGLLLLIGCANVAGLLHGRAAARQHEIATRLALGARRGRLFRQLLTESLVLALAGGAAGIVVAIGLTRSANLLAAGLPVPMQFDLSVDRLVLFYALGLSTATSLLFGLAPARQASRMDLVAFFRAPDGPASGQRLRRLLVMSQVVICTALLVWSGLFLRSLGHVAAVDPGFDPTGVVLARVTLSQDAHDRARDERVLLDLQQQIAAAPFVESAGMALVVPLVLTSNEEFYVSRDLGASESALKVVANRLTPGWFQTVRIPLMAGRDFTWNDREGAPGVALVNETLARRLWNGNAIGAQLAVPVPGNTRRLVEVIGIARDSKYGTLGEPTAPAVYLPVRQAYLYDMTLHVRTRDARAAGLAIQEATHRLAPGVPLDVVPMEQAVAAALMPPRVGAALTTAFGVVAIVLSMLGLYGLVSYSVVQRTREIGIRCALGGRTIDIVRLIVGGNARWTAMALAGGLALGAAGASVFGGFVIGVAATDPATLLGVTSIVFVTTLGASLVPVLRASAGETTILKHL